MKKSAIIQVEKPGTYAASSQGQATQKIENDSDVKEKIEEKAAEAVEAAEETAADAAETVEAAAEAAEEAKD